GTDGGAGGRGGLGGAGGDGGGGGGAIKIVAGDRATFQRAVFDATGASIDEFSSLAGDAGSFGVVGTNVGETNFNFRGEGEGPVEPEGGRGGDGGFGGTGGTGGTGGRGGTGGDGGDGASGSVKFIAAALEVQGTFSEVDVSKNGSGDEGRVILQTNAVIVDGRQDDVDQGAVRDATGRAVGVLNGAAANPFLSGAQQTPVFAGVAGDGAATAGVVEGLTIQTLIDDFGGDFDADFEAQLTQDGDALVAVLRLEDMPAPLSLLTGSNAFDRYEGFDALLVVNLTDVALAAPKIGIGVGSAAAPAPLALTSAGGVIDALGAGQIWATLVPEGQDAVVSASLFGDDARAPADRASTLLAGESLDRPGEIAFLSPQRPDIGAAAAPLSFGAVEARADGSVVYGLDVAKGDLVVINADGSQRQALPAAEIEALQGAHALVVYEAEGPGARDMVYVATDDALLSFSADAQGELTLQETRALGAVQSLALGDDGTTLAIVAADAGGAAVALADLTVNDIPVFSAPAAAAPADQIVFGAAGAQGTLFGVDAAAGTVSAFDIASQTFVALDASDRAELSGASTIAVDAQGFVHVGTTDSTLVTLSYDPAAGLEVVSVLRNGVDGVRGMTEPAAIRAVGDFILVAGKGADSLVALQQRTDDTGAFTGELVFAQALRDDVGGAGGLDAVAALDVYETGGQSFVVAGSLGSDGAPGAVAVFSLDLAAPPPTLYQTEFSGVEALSITTGAGNDAVALISAPTVEVVKIDVETQGGEDAVSILDTPAKGAESLASFLATPAAVAEGGVVVRLGDGADTATLRATTPDGSVVVLGDAGQDDISVVAVGERMRAAALGGGQNDVIRVTGTGLPDTMEALRVSGSNGTDSLFFDPGDFAQNVLDDRVDGRIGIGLPGFGIADQDQFELISTSAPPQIDLISADPVIDEGQGFTFDVEVRVDLAGLDGQVVSFDLDGDGLFDDAVAPATEV
ncbi:MAG: hypothetical protein AAF192_20675, partial [Pseudomonadota bacterium]